MSNIRVSICIPTKNFGEFIGETLKSIIDQSVDGLEIVVVDGGSTDNTYDVVKNFKEKFPDLYYFQQEKANGVDKDLATAIKFARGDYCWLMSADDVLKPGAVARIFEEIDLGLNTYLYNRTLCDKNLQPVDDNFWLNDDVDDTIVHFSNRSEIIKYFNTAKSLGALFSYISSIVFSRLNWLEVHEDPLGEGTNYQHAFKLFKMLGHSGVHKYIKEQLVFCRGQNDSFLEKGDSGLVKRFMIDFDGYRLLGSRNFFDSRERNSFMSVMQREHHWLMLIRLAIRVKESDEWLDIRGKLVDFGYKDYQLNILSALRTLEKKVLIFKALRKLRTNFKSFER